MKRPLSLLILLGLAGLAALRVVRGSRPEEPPAASLPRAIHQESAASDELSTRPSASFVAPPRTRRTATPASTPAAPPPVRFNAPLEDEEAPPQVSSPLRAPIVDAIRASMGGEQKRRAILEAVRSSGESDEAWTAEAGVAFDTWQQAMPMEQRARLNISQPVCYAAGCVADVTFPDAASHRAAAQAFRELTESNAGHGGRVQTPAEAQGGALVASWIMLRPNEL